MDGVSILLSLFRELHQQLRDELDDLADGDLNWVPVPEANSIATIVTHLVGSEAETLRSVAGSSHERDREAEFAQSTRTKDEILLLLEDADRLLNELSTQIDLNRLSDLISLPTLPAEEVCPGLRWLVGNYGHAREHLGQIQLTKQLRRC